MQFKIRCSAIGEIMGVKGLGKTGESYLQTWYKERLYARRKEFTSKYTDKGLIQEDAAIDLVSDYLNLGMVFKNDRFVENEFMQGTADIVLNNCILDIKCPWDCFSFPLLDEEVPNKDYWWQMQGYMNLYQKDSAKIAYVLMDAPENIVEQEARRESYRMGCSELDMDIYEQIREKMTYSHLPLDLRVKIFEVKKCDKSIELIEQRVNECRNYLTKFNHHLQVK